MSDNETTIEETPVETPVETPETEQKSKPKKVKPKAKPTKQEDSEQKSKPKKSKSKAKPTKQEDSDEEEEKPTKVKSKAKPEVKKPKKSKPKAKPKTILCKYVKRDKYKNTIMLVSKDSDDLCDGYIKVKSLYKKLRHKFSTNLPFWLEKKKEFATIRFKKSALTTKLKDLAIYEIQFTMNQTSNKDGDKFVNLNVVEVKLISEHDPGKQLDISSDDDEDLETSEDSDDDDDDESGSD
jgi:hypothetical protein